MLDHGYVEFIEAWGIGRQDRVASGMDIDGLQYDSRDLDHEVGIIEAARQSTQGSFRGWETDAKLLRFLYEHQHATPFEFAGMVIEVRAPLFVFREWHRHRTQSYNEASARYAPLPDDDYTPDVLRIVTGSQSIAANRQAASMSNRVCYDKDAEQWLADLRLIRRQLESHYQVGLNIGVPKELARLAMTVGRYSQMRACTDLRNWLAFLTLRMDPAAQWEIRQYANAVGEIVAKQFPLTWKLFEAERS